MGGKPGDPNEALSIRVEGVSANGKATTRYEWRCPVCQGSFWTPLCEKTETCSFRCAMKLRSIRRPSKQSAAKVFVAEVNSRTFCAHCGAQPVEWHNPEHVELKRENFRINK